MNSLVQPSSDGPRNNDVIEKKPMKREAEKSKPGCKGKNGHPIPHYIVHGDTDLAKANGLDLGLCQFIREPAKSEEHRKNREALFAEWEAAGAQHVYRDKHD